MLACTGKGLQHVRNGSCRISDSIAGKSGGVVCSHETAKGIPQATPPIDAITARDIPVPCPKPKKLGRRIPNPKHESLIIRVSQTRDGKDKRPFLRKGN